MERKINILFYSPAVPAVRYDNVQDIKTLYLNTVPLYLNSYIKLNNKPLYDMLCWKDIVYHTKTQQDIIEIIEKEDIDVFCCSIYVWNRVNIEEIVSNIKQKLNKNITIIVGGPSVSSKEGSVYLEKNPEVDYVVFSSGEIPFNDILSHIYLGKALNPMFTSNVAWRKNGDIVEAGYKFFENSKYSPYLESKDLLIQITKDIKNQGYNFEFPYETSRGCPYSCSFCDWTSGLSSKTTKRNVNYREELELLGSLNITKLFFADANFGMWPIDVDIAKTIVELKDKYDFKTYTPNFSKNKKDRVFEIMDLFLKHDVVDICKFSAQDIDHTVLENIDRPDIPWDEHKLYIKKIMEMYPHKQFKLELIKGLPGQTRTSWIYNILESYKLKLPLQAYNWMLIPNSPGYEQSYRDKFNIQVIKSDTDIRAEFVVASYSHDELDFSFFSVSEYFYRILFYLEVEQHEMEEFMRWLSGNLPEEVLRTSLQLIVKYSIFPQQYGDVLVKRFLGSHPLRIKYQTKWDEYSKNYMVVHKNLPSEHVL